MLFGYLYGKLKRTTSTGFFIPEIDGLRFLAIILVILIHINVFVIAKHFFTATAVSANPILEKFFFNGFKGVELFFVISGFILALPFAGHYLKNKDKVNLKKFYLRRLTRLEPPYIFSLVAIFFLSVLVGKFDFKPMLPSFAASLFYLHNFFTGLPWINAITWSLEIEIQFYLLTPLLALIFLLKNNYRRLVLLATIFILPVLQYYFLPGVRTLYNYLQFFLIGYLLADLYVNEIKINLPKSISLILGSALLATIIFLDISDKYIGVNQGEPLYNSFIFLSAITIFYYLVLNDIVWKKIFSWKLLTSIGGMCYTLYLWHTIIISWAGNRLLSLTFPGNYPLTIFLQIAVLLPAVVLVGSVFYLLIEKPCMDKEWPKKLYLFSKARYQRLFILREDKPAIDL